MTRFLPTPDQKNRTRSANPAEIQHGAPTAYLIGDGINSV